MTTIQILSHLSDISGIPATLFQNGEEPFHVPELPYLDKLVRHIPSALQSGQENASCLFTEDHLGYGHVRINSRGDHVLFGPVATFAFQNETVQQMLKTLGLPTTETGRMLGYLNSLPICSLQKFTNFILFANYVLNGETLPIQRLLPTDFVYVEDLGAATPFEQDTRTIHDAKAYEDRLFSLIRLGRYEEMQVFLRQSTFTGNTGALAGSQMRHYRNLIISSVAICARSAVDGGLDYETAMRIADTVIQKAELAPDVKSLYKLHKNMLLTYTRKVAESKLNHANSALSAKVEAFISRHLQEEITGSGIAEALCLSRAYLSHQFRKETGITLMDFINDLKIEEARRLLSTTDLPISEIAGLLAYSSQSYFQTVFKRHTGKTPGKYRER